MLAITDPSNSFAVRFFWLRIDTLIVTISYFLGSIPFGLLVARTRGIDIRKHGSGNIGATNVMRTLGKGPGYTVFACDVLKGVIAVLIAKYIASHHSMNVSQSIKTIDGAIFHTIHIYSLPVPIAAISAAIACIIGHNFPIWLGFKGGKGMATSGGVIAAMMPQTAMACILVWAAVFFSTRYVSLASIAAAIALPLFTVIFLSMGLLYGWPYFYFALAAAVLAVVRHRANIVRLMNGTENRFERKTRTPA